MEKRLLNIVSILLILIVLPASSGISIYHHICGLEGDHSISLFAETTCHHDEVCTGPCHEEDTHQQNEGGKIGCEDLGNCLNYHYDIFLDNEYLVISSEETSLEDSDLLAVFLHLTHLNLNSKKSLVQNTGQLDFKIQTKETIAFIQKTSFSKTDDDISLT